MVPQRLKTILSSAACRMKESLISKVTRRAQRFLSMGLISWSKARSFPLCGVEVRPSDSTPSRSHRLAWRVTPRSIRKRSCVRRPLGRTGGAQLARMFRRTDVPSTEPSRPPVSCTYVRRLFSRQTIFLGPKTEQSFVHVVLIHLPHAPTPLPGLDII